MKTIKELKSAARQSLSGKWGSSAVLCLVYFVLTFVLCYVVTLLEDLFTSDYDPSQGSLSGIIFYLILAIMFLPLYWAFIVVFLNVACGNSCKIGNLFDGYNDFGRICGTMLLQTVYIWLWSLLLLIPGIIKYYSYALTPYILNDDSYLSYNGAIDKSMAMMKGHKKDLFLLDLYSIGWIIIGYGLICLLNQFLFEHKIRDMIFTFILPPIFISLFWLIPYWKTARAHFYLDLKAQQEQTSVEGV